MDLMKYIITEAIALKLSEMFADQRTHLGTIAGIQEVRVTRPTKLVTMIGIKQEGKPIRFFEVRVSEPIS